MNTNAGKKHFFIIYQITNLLSNKIYVGAHATYNVNDKYMGSSKYLKKDMKGLGRHNFRKDILHVFDCKEDMIGMEAKIVNKEFCMRTDTYNRIVGGITEWTSLGMVTVKNPEGGHMNVYKDDPRYVSGELEPTSKGLKLFDKLFKEPGSLERCKRVASENMKQAHKDGKIKYNTFEGKSHSEETKNKMSAQAALRLGQKNSQYGSCWITNGVENKKIKKEELAQWEDKEWRKGRVTKV